MAKTLTPEQRALSQSIGVHVLVLLVLVFSVNFDAAEMPEVSTSQPLPVIKATFIDAQAIADKQKAEAAAAAAEAEKKRKERAAAERRKRAAEVKRAKEKARQEAEKKRKKEQELKRLAAQKAKERKEREAKAKADAERKKREAAEQAEAERQMQEQLAAEQQALQQKRNKFVLSEQERYTALIRQTIMRYLIEDDSFEGKTCRLNIRLATTGLVTKVTRLSGDSALCRAAESAVRRPDKLPMSSELDVYEKLKDITIRVEL